MTATEIAKITESTRFKFKDEKGRKYWEDLVSRFINYPTYNECLEFANRWGRLMQVHINEGNSLIKIASKAASDADLNNITSHQLMCATFCLVNCWEYGDQLGNWYAEKFGNTDNV